MNTARPEAGGKTGAFQASREANTGRLGDLLLRAGRLQRWLAQPIEADLRAQLVDDQRRLADELLEALVSWVDLGGTVTLGEVDLDRAGPPVVVERKGAPPAPPVVVVTAPLAPPVREPREPREPSAVVVARPPSASGDALRSLAKHFEAGSQVKSEGIAANWEEMLAKVVADLGVPGEDGDAELLVLQNVVRDADRWRALPREVQRTLVGLITARLRRSQDEMGVSGTRLDDTFSMLSAWSKREQPGWVNGLSRGHVPTRGSWTADAEAYAARLPRAEPPPAAKENIERQLSAVSAFATEFDTAPAEAMEAVAAQFRTLVRKAIEGGVRATDPRLVKLCAARVELFDGPEFRYLRRALREEAEPADVDDDEKAPALPPDWAWWGRTRYRRGVLVGGDPRELNRERLERAFGFAELEWVGTEFKRNNLQTVRDRVRAGKLDIVIILGAFVGHDADEVILPAARECGVDWVHVDKGYGIVRVRRAIERFLDPLASR